MTAFSESLPAMIIGLVINSIGLVPLQAALTAIVADVGDLVYWKTGVPVQGSVFSLTSAGMKIGQGITAALVAWSLSLGGYIAGASVQLTAPSPPLNRCNLLLAMVVLMLITMVGLNYERLLPRERGNLEGKRRRKPRRKHYGKLKTIDAG